MSKIDNNILNSIPSPSWLLEEELLEKNLKILKNIKDKTGVKILLALKGYALWKSFNLIKKYLDGCCASGLNEALLAYEEFGKEVHTYSPAFKANEIEKIAKISNHIVFNSNRQLKSYYNLVKKINPNISIGLRVNPQISSAPAEIYNPCSPTSRLGIKIEDFEEESLNYIDGLHFHALCEEDSSSLQLVLEAFEKQFSKYFDKLKWVNFGGGHHITKKEYNKELLVKLLNDFKFKYPHLQIYLEPGEGVGWESGVLVATILDIVKNGNLKIAILDISAEAHMPDTIIMPYRAKVRGAKEANILPYTYQLAGNTCLSGDIMGLYSFTKELKIGDKIIFEDQMHYTMVKATTFNGINLPSISILRKNGKIDIIKDFGYCDFKNRLS